MGLPRVYQQAAEGAIATYNYTEISEGTGIVLFYGFTDQENASGDGFALTSSTPYSDTIETVKGLGAGFDIDFDLSPFNLPQTIEGTGMVSFSWAQKTNAATSFVTAKIRKWDGTTETEIASTSGAIQDWASAAPRTDLIKIENIPRTLFKKGETLRLNMSSTIASGNPETVLAHDPKDRDGTDIVPSTDASSTTKLEFHCPFRLDL